MKINDRFPSDIIMGIYKIENTKNHKVYIGSSKDIYNRWKQHIKMLEAGKHHSYKLQRTYDRLKDKSVLQFDIIEEVSDSTDLKIREQYYIDKYDAFNTGYNCSALSDNPKYTSRKARKTVIKNNQAKKRKENILFYEEFNDIYDDKVFLFPTKILDRIKNKEYKFTGMRRILCLMRLFIKYFKDNGLYCWIYLNHQDAFMRVFYDKNKQDIIYKLECKRAVAIYPISKYDVSAFIDDKDFDKTLFDLINKFPILR